MEDAYHNDHKSMWQLVKRFFPSGKKANLEPIKFQNGELATSQEQILRAWREHLESLGAPTHHELEDVAFGESTDRYVRAMEKYTHRVKDKVMDEVFCLAELKAVLEGLDYHKAGTADGTVNLMFKCGVPEVLQPLLDLFNWLRETERIPVDWQKAMIVNLYKDGDKSDPGNYRGIALISCLGKIYLSLWAARLAAHADGVLGDPQGGFRRGRSTVDQCLTLKEALVRRKRAGLDTFLCFVDFRKAFDTVWHAGLWRRLWDSGARGKAWRVVRNLYSSISAQVLLGGEATAGCPPRVSSLAHPL